MKIEISNKDDISGMYSLWQNAFGDERDFIDKFFSLWYKEENALVCREDGQVCSMLFLLDADLVLEGEARKAFYVYAAATDEKYKNRGFMTSLLEFAKKTARERGADYLFLHPANRGLYSFYEKNGFCACFYKRNTYISRNCLEKNSFQSYNYVKWDSRAFEFNSFSSGGKPFINDFGYADVKRIKDSLYINSFCSDKPARLLSSVMQKYGFDGAYVNLPTCADGVFGKRTKTGMLLCLNGNNAPRDDIFLGITLE